jgi:DNA-directed RNA polymerase specialized sigma54-like protein
MNHVEVKQIRQLRQLPVLINKIELVEFIQLSEKEFAELIRQIEDDALFKKLASTADQDWKVITRERFPKADMSNKFYELKEENSADKSLFDVESVLDNHKECIPIIKDIGEEIFKEYFLYNESMTTQQEIADRCGLSINKVKKVTELINQVSINLEFCYPSSIDSQHGVHYTKVASIEKDGSADFVIKYFSPYFTRGKYSINHDKLNKLKSKREFSLEEVKKLNKLLHKLELINNRKSTIHKVIQEIIEGQNSFLVSGKEEDIVSFKQKDLAKNINIDPGLICRAINGRSIVTPKGEEIPIKYLFPTKKKIRKKLIKNIISEENKSLTDEEIRGKLREKYGMEISRRSIADSRKELKIASSSKRKLDNNK